MIKDIKLPQAIVICVVFLGTLAGVWLFARAGLDPTPALILGGGVLTALGLGTVVAQNQQIRDNTNGVAAAQLATIRHLAAIVAMSQPTPEARELAAKLAVPSTAEAGEGTAPPG